MSALRLLDVAASGVLDDDSYYHGPRPELNDFLSDFPRVVRLELVEELLAEAAERQRSGGIADQWLAPRLHAALRITRLEAANPAVWAYLAVENSAGAAYVRERWPQKQEDQSAGGLSNRLRKRLFDTQHSKQSLARLWWGAEVFRNGSDYSPVLVAFKNQDIPNTLLGTRAVHYRPAALAFMRFLSSGHMRSESINRISTAVGFALSMKVLESMGEDNGVDGECWAGWIAASPPPTVLSDILPEGPREFPVSESAVNEVLEIILGAAREAELL